MATTQQTSGTLYNALTAGSKIIGQIITDGDIRVDGIIDGTIECSGKVVIGEQGLVKGQVQCHNAEIMGHLNGKLSVSETLALRASGVIEGDIVTRTLIIEPEAQFNGTCKMGTKASEPNPKK